MQRKVKVVCTFLILALTLTLGQLTLGQLQPGNASTMPSGDTLQQRLSGAVALYIDSSIALVNNKETPIDAGNPAVKPLIKNGTTLVPVRFISQSLGAKVTWDGKTSTSTIKLKNKVVKLTLKSKNMKVDKTNVKLEVAPQFSNGRVFVPVEQLANALGKKVFYDRGLIIIGAKENLFNTQTEKKLIDAIITRVNNLPAIASMAELKKMIASSNSYYYRNTKGALDSVAVPEAAPGNAEKDGATASTDYSKTNVQVDGVDEADVVKTDGEYIYQVNNQRVVIIKAVPAQEMQILHTLDFKDKNFYPQELYVDSKYMVVIGSGYENVVVDTPAVKDNMKIALAPDYYGSPKVKAIIYDIRDKANIKQLREVEIEGYYVSSRKIGANLYLVANKGIWYVQSEGNARDLLPQYKDSALGDSYKRVKYTDIRYFSEEQATNFLVIAGLNLDQNSEPVQISTYLGSGQNIYVSQQNMYVAVTTYEAVAAYDMAAEKDQVNVKPEILPAKPIMPEAQDTTKTMLYKFSLSNGTSTFLAKGEVPGTILNQFSMDEHNKHFRIATTHGFVWRNDEYTSKNNIYILDELMNLTGKIENIAPGERIYSTRFMGDRGYMVTFKTVDPLFVLDLKDPKNPKILGELKIPGYSEYLHPYDENHIIGIGKDAVESGNIGYYQGLKLAIFDVSDVSNPKQKFSTNIGDRGSDTEVLRNHKALLFDKSKNLLALPVMVMEKIQGSNVKTPEAEIFEYGQFSFQGAYVYNIDLTNGFKLKGKISHLSKEDYGKDVYGYWGDKTVERVLYIGDNIYTLSKAMVKANSMSDLQIDTGKVLLPQNEVGDVGKVQVDGPVDKPVDIQMEGSSGQKQR